MTEETKSEECGAGCSCSGNSGLGMKTKVLVSMLVAIAAAVVLANRISSRQKNDAEKNLGSFDTTAVTAGEDCAASCEGRTDCKRPGGCVKLKAESIEQKGKSEEAGAGSDKTASAWGEPLGELAALNQAAADSDGVFVLLLPTDTEGKGITKEIDAAIGKLTSSGKSVSAFKLLNGTVDHTRISMQLPPPSVLVFAKMGGTLGVDQPITEAALLEAFVKASMPRSACGGGSCDPGKACD